jgi:endo-1,3-1,4-beta-glycanase ExoK
MWRCLVRVRWSEIGFNATGVLLWLAAGCAGDGTAQRTPQGVAPSSSLPSEAPSAPSTPTSAEPGGIVGAPSGSVPASGEAVDATRNPEAPADPNAAAPPTAQTADGFELAWQDDFDALDASRWQLMTHTWDTNLAQFSTANASVGNGLLSLALSAEPTDTVKPFRGVEMRSRETLRYGKVEARARLAKGSGVVSALVLIYTPWPADNWNELDIEYLGRYSDRVQFNAMVYTGPPTQPPVVESVVPTQSPQLVNLAFDPSGDFHVYGMEWTPTEARFTIDGATQHTWNTEIARLALPMNILLTIWASSSADWAGPVQATTVPTTADYDWIRVYRWLGASPAP